jgi:hypothetical protein
MSVADHLIDMLVSHEIAIVPLKRPRAFVCRILVTAVTPCTPQARYTLSGNFRTGVLHGSVDPSYPHAVYCAVPSLSLVRSRRRGALKRLPPRLPPPCHRMAPYSARGKLTNPTPRPPSASEPATCQNALGNRFSSISQDCAPRHSRRDN